MKSRSRNRQADIEIAEAMPEMRIEPAQIVKDRCRDQGEVAGKGIAGLKFVGRLDNMDVGYVIGVSEQKARIGC